MPTVRHYQPKKLSRKTIHYDTSKPLPRILRRYFYCSVCKTKSRRGWDHLTPCPFCGARFSLKTMQPTCTYGKSYTPEEEQAIMNWEGACHP